MQSDRDTSRRLIFNIVTVIALAVCFTITTFAITRKYAVSHGIFLTGEVKININDGLPIINSDDLLLEPGMTIEKEFFVKNEGDCDVYFKVYFDNVDGELANVLNIKVMDGDSILFNGTPKKFTKLSTTTADNVLKQDETRKLKISFYYPEAEGNAEQGSELSFNLCAQAVQAKNNANKDFE